MHSKKKVRTQEVLWDVKHGNYSKKVLERAIWNEICQELKAEHSGQTSHSTTDPVMGKFTYLRETIRSYCKKTEETPSGSAGGVTPKWEYFTVMSILRPVYSISRNYFSFTLHNMVFEGTLEDLDLLATLILPSTTIVLSMSTIVVPSFSFALSPSLALSSEPSPSPSSSSAPSPLPVLSSAIPPVSSSIPSLCSAPLPSPILSSAILSMPVSTQSMLFLSLSSASATVHSSSSSISAPPIGLEPHKKRKRVNQDEIITKVMKSLVAVSSL